jgi:hypothetical protein
MKQTLSRILMVASCAVVLSACEYNESFNGSYNGTPASLTAYSSNINRYCVALNLTAGSVTDKSFISAQAVYDENDPFATKTFNTKGSDCSQNLSEYLIGTRNVQVINTTQVSSINHLNSYQCQVVYYKEYTFIESLNFEIHRNNDDSMVGSFAGSASAETYTDTDRPVSYGQIYQCGVIYQPGPQPYPYPQPGYPQPYPNPGYPYPGYPNPGYPHPQPYPYPQPHPYPQPQPHPYPGPVYGSPVGHGGNPPPGPVYGSPVGHGGQPGGGHHPMI